MATMILQLHQLHSNNVSAFQRSPLSEISGSLGDLGTLLPLMITLAVNNSISLSTTLVFSGLWNILTGVVFGSMSSHKIFLSVLCNYISFKLRLSSKNSLGGKDMSCEPSTMPALYHALQYSFFFRHPILIWRVAVPLPVQPMKVCIFVCRSWIELRSDSPRPLLQWPSQENSLLKKQYLLAS